ncbi:MAG: hypothetical protein IPI35_22080 [Deltaproteobacteria bacterium]|nr:hypothetical protein [Deltaproteobacteria bacterium]
MERAPRMNASLCPSLPTFWALAALLTASISAAGCKDRSSDSDDTAPKPEWTILGEALPGALLSVTGRARDDVWTVGGDDGEGPLVLHLTARPGRGFSPRAPATCGGCGSATPRCGPSAPPGGCSGLIPPSTSN